MLMPAATDEPDSSVPMLLPAATDEPDAKRVRLTAPEGEPKLQAHSESPVCTHLLACLQGNEVFKEFLTVQCPTRGVQATDVKTLLAQLQNLAEVQAFERLLAGYNGKVKGAKEALAKRCQIFVSTQTLPQEEEQAKLLSTFQTHFDKQRKALRAPAAPAATPGRRSRTPTSRTPVPRMPGTPAPAIPETPPPAIPGTPAPAIPGTPAVAIPGTPAADGGAPKRKRRRVEPEAPREPREEPTTVNASFVAEMKSCFEQIHKKYEGIKHGDHASAVHKGVDHVINNAQSRLDLAFFGHRLFGLTRPNAKVLEDFHENVRSADPTIVDLQSFDMTTIPKKYHTAFKQKERSLQEYGPSPVLSWSASTGPTVEERQLLEDLFAILHPRDDGQDHNIRCRGGYFSLVDVIKATTGADDNYANQQVRDLRRWKDITGNYTVCPGESEFARAAVPHATRNVMTSVREQRSPCNLHAKRHDFLEGAAFPMQLACETS